MRASTYKVSTRFTLCSVGLLCLVTAMACGDSGVNNPAAPSATGSGGISPTSIGDGASLQALRQDTTDLCHRHPQTGEFRQFSVPGPAVDGHLRHGDALVGDPVPGSPGLRARRHGSPNTV